MSAPVDFVRFRNDGDDFHVLWTARRSLRILDPSSGLVAVAVEGISDQEDQPAGPVLAGLLVIDTTEYFGSEEIASADKIVYNQLKYSTTSSSDDWTISGLASTLAGFSSRFKALNERHGPTEVSTKIRFRFLSNRPISSAVQEAVRVARLPRAPSNLAAPARTALAALKKAVALKGPKLQAFASMLELQGTEPHRFEQNTTLVAEASSYLSHNDPSSSLALKELVRSKGRSESKKNPVIRREDILTAFRVIEEELLPAPATFEELPSLVSRSQDSHILRQILEATGPVIVHAEGGVGKSILAQRLGSMLPEGSETVVFDGFASGAYRTPRDRRHRHDRGLVHIANTLATRSLCNPILPQSASNDSAYLRAFWSRIEGAAAVISKRSANAILLIVLDAADNSVSGALERSESCFVPDLLADRSPPNCRIVAFARTHRVGTLGRVNAATAITLQAFTREESGTHLRRFYPEATDDQVESFHKFTAFNPRVQKNALTASKDLEDLLSRLGPAPLTVELLIQGQLVDAFNRVINEQGGESELRRLGMALAALPPPIPTVVLSQVSNLSISGIASFCSDFAGGRPLLISNEALQFRDEPVETWFREYFLPTPADFGSIADSLAPLSATDPYAASSLPLLLWNAARHEELFRLSLSEVELEDRDTVERREIFLRRLQFAIRSAIKLDRIPDATKLLLRSAEEIATGDRQSDFLVENADLVTFLAGVDTAYEFIFRKRPWQHDGKAYCHCAAMLAADAHSRAEARHFLGLAISWLQNWSVQNKDNRVRVEVSDITSYAFAEFHLNGAKAAAQFISGWSPKALHLQAGLELCERFIDRGNIDAVNQLLAASGTNLYLRLSCLHSLFDIYERPSKEEVSETITLLTQKPLEIGHDAADGSVVSTIAAISEIAILVGIEADVVLNLIEPYSAPPKHLRRSYSGETFKDPELRLAALRAALSNRSVSLDDVRPSSIPTLEPTKGQPESSEVRDFRKTYGPLLPWYALRASAIVTRISSPDLATRIAQAISDSDKFVDGWRWGRDQDLRYTANDVPVLWFDVLMLSGDATDTAVLEIEKWIRELNVSIFTPTWTTLARKSVGRPELHRATLRFAKICVELLSAEHTDARSFADNLVSLSRALLRRLPQESEAHFSSALEHLNRLGDELHERFFALVRIAEKAADSSTPKVYSAYRFARMTEVFNEYNSHKFPWRSAASTIAKLCPASALAILSRWDDRHAGWLGDTLPSALLTMAKRGAAPSHWIAASHALGGYWDLRGSALGFLTTAGDQTQRQLILDLIVKDIEYGLNDEYESCEDLLKTARDLGLNHHRLSEVVSYRRSLPDRNGGSHYTRHSSSDEAPTPINWEPIVTAGSPLDPDGIAEIDRRHQASQSRGCWDDLDKEIRATIQPANWRDHLSALARVPERDLWRTLSSLSSAAADWTDSAAARKGLQEAIVHLIESRPLEFRVNQWTEESDLQRCVAISGLAYPDLLKKLLAAAASQLEHASAETIFGFSSAVSKALLTSTEAEDVLSFGLDRTDFILKEEDGDGHWQSELQPPHKLSDAFASFLYARLASPDSKGRWRAAHAVRRICQFSDTSVIRGLVDQLQFESLPAFTDRKLAFYSMHARLYLLIALARVAEENPSVLIPHVTAFLPLASRDNPHVLIRHFAAELLLALHKFDASLISEQEVSELRKINQSNLPARDRSSVEGLDSFSPEAAKDTESFHLHFDFGRYWLESLASSFNKRASQLEHEAVSVIKGWRLESGLSWESDVRLTRQYFQDRDTLGGQGSYPDVDTLSFYLSYHAMFCVAGMYLEKFPLLRDDRWYEERWPRWLERHRLTRVDGRWISDRKDNPPLVLRPWQMEKDAKTWNQEWAYSLSADDFEDVLGLTHAGGSLVVHGNWLLPTGHGHESIRIRSALVSPSNSLALLRALQTSGGHNYSLPVESRDGATRRPGFRLSGWIHVPELDLRLDGMDPVAGRIPWPGPQPGRAITRLFRLKKDEEGRIWTASGKNVFQLRIWGDATQGRHDRPRENGTKLTVDLAWLTSMLQSIKRDLIFKVSIERSHGNREAEISYEFRDYCRVFVFKPDGSLYSLRGVRSLW